ncbi:MAG: bile acid:sodium symporter [Deltaproteobacteria bacterium]|jgi:sodium/bile acid cotransporter 7|nr:bile acid:sodium symporter [Deltaproteobacteria bacterium]
MGSILSKAKGLFDFLTIGLIAAIALAFLAPPRGAAASFFSFLTNLTVFFLFFLHGAKLSPRNLLAGLSSFKAHATITFSTFAMFPLTCLALKPLFGLFVSPELVLGIMFLSVLPSTVQSSITFTSIAGGNVGMAVCAASFSSLLGVFATPFLTGLVIDVPGAGPSKLSVLWDLCLLLLFPFALGQLARPRIKGFMGRHSGIIFFCDRISVIFIVFASFSHAVAEGLWNDLRISELLSLLVVLSVILALALAFTALAGRLLGFAPADRAAILFCGSKKSLMAGVPMAGIIFSQSLSGVVIIPLMIFHQLQLVVCAQIARALSKRNLGGTEPDDPDEPNAPNAPNEPGKPEVPEDPASGE